VDGSTLRDDIAASICLALGNIRIWRHLLLHHLISCALGGTVIGYQHEFPAEAMSNLRRNFMMKLYTILLLWDLGYGKDMLKP